MGLFAFWILFGVVTALIARNKGEPVITAFIVGIILGPIGLIIIFLIAGKKCPYCKSRIHTEAIICPKCQQNLPRETKINPMKKLY